MAGPLLMGKNPSPPQKKSCHQNKKQVYYAIPIKTMLNYNHTSKATALKFFKNWSMATPNAIIFISN